MYKALFVVCFESRVTKLLYCSCSSVSQRDSAEMLFVLTVDFKLSVHTLERCLEFLIRVWQQSTVPPASHRFTEGPCPLWAKKNSNASNSETVAWEQCIVVFLGLAYGPCLLRRVTPLSFWDTKPYCSNWYHDRALPNDMRAQCSFVSITL